MGSPKKFNAFRYALRSLWHYRRVNLAVLLGVLVATAVLTGALIVGDSVRGSLRRLTIERLGQIDQILLADHFFHQDLVARTRQRQPELAGYSGAKRSFCCHKPAWSMPRRTTRYIAPTKSRSSAATTRSGTWANKQDIRGLFPRGDKSC